MLQGKPVPLAYIGWFHPADRTGGFVLQSQNLPINTKPFILRRFTGLCIRDQASKFACRKYLPSHEDLTTDPDSSFHSSHSSKSIIVNCLRLEEFARILRIPCQGVCVFSTEWSISSLSKCIDPNPTIYLSPIEDPKVVCGAIFYERPPGKTCKIKKKSVVLDPYQMDHPNVCIAYMLYFLTIQKPFNLAYYITKRMESVTRSDVMVLPYGMLLTRLYRHVHTSHPIAISDIHYLVDHVMIPLTEGKTRKIMIDRKRPHPQTPSESSSLSSHSQNQGKNDPVDNYTLDPIAYTNQLLPIEGGEFLEFKQTKGMFKCFGHFLSNLRKKK
ncbi:hypothetical protein Tco_0174142 [Tanacetum coccineum]